MDFIFHSIFSSRSDCKPLWAFEDITPRNGTVKSAEQLESFLQIIVQLFDDALPNALLPGRWARESLHWATSCSSRHYAGRSFQIFRSLKIPLSWPMLSDILQRLVESVADSSDDVQVSHLIFVTDPAIHDIRHCFNSFQIYVMNSSNTRFFL